MASYDTEEWLETLTTHSDHRMLAEGVRKLLPERVGWAIDSHGGRVDVESDAVVILNPRRPRYLDREQARPHSSSPQAIQDADVVRNE
ncbi:MAG: hypothetical protein ACYCSF_08205 [Acidimicrobiales bacterium]